ncbi:XRE family transcriptional regulator [Marinitoga sp. 1135]|uniref:response regulator transcription factor n=1 Tax=unclassified Marinitoga TaxID=2640159 RepID=UPI0015866BAA|nr:MULTISPECIES: response regulator transcription factor [unclassified Marinitoga]NUU95261.1 XRE family transcriptional regulator [Marinitoga sp. 1135]NUU97195.1 XRE family transcriptional regulator [Marinitoga sp. 1138]
MKILIIEDEKSILDLIKMNLILEDFEVISSERGEDGINLFKSEMPDLVILDLMLPDIDGFEVLKELQNMDYNIPIIILTAKNNQNDKLLGLELGADDYITKPFDSKELILRIRNILKRIKKSRFSNDDKTALNVRNKILIYPDERKVLIDSKEIYFTKKEFELFYLLVKNTNKVLSRNAILEKIWGFDSSIDTRAVDMTVQRIRKKIGKCGYLIKSLYGVGYKFEISNEE